MEKEVKVVTFSLPYLCKNVMTYKAKILVIDDEIDILDLLEMLLTTEGYEVFQASNGVDGLLYADIHQPDLILLDLMMPGMDGYAVISSLKDKPSVANIPVIMLTAMAQAKEKIKGLTAGAEDYITKPFDTKELILRIESVLNRTLPVKYMNPLISAMGNWYSEDAVEQLASHLQAAAAIQRGLEPKKPPQIPGFDIAGCLHSSMSISGDFYDFIQLNDHCFGLVIADVRGKGIPAALLMAMIRTALRLVGREEATRHTSPAANVLKRVNDLIATDTAPDLFATIVYGILDVHPTTDENIQQPCTFRYANAGHCYPLHVVDEQVRTLTVGGLLLGSFEFANFDEELIELKAGHILLFYTDGIVEAEGPDGQPYGEKRLQQVLLQSRYLSADGICQRISSSLDQFIKTGKIDRLNADSPPESFPRLKDDLAMIVVKVRENQTFDLETN